MPDAPPDDVALARHLRSQARDAELGRGIVFGTFRPQPGIARQLRDRAQALEPATPSVRRAVPLLAARRARRRGTGGRPATRQRTSAASSRGDPDLADEPPPPRPARLSFACLTAEQRGASV